MQKKKVKKSAIVIDDWKLPFFKVRLDASKFDYAQSELKITDNTYTLFVETNEVWRLGQVVRASNDAAASHKKFQQMKQKVKNKKKKR